MVPTIYASATLQVLANAADPARCETEGYELVTFEPLWRNPRSRPFGDRFAAKYRLNALHIVPVDNSWYQYPDMEDCLAAVARVTAPDVVAMGASMGAYGVVTLADRFGAKRSIAIAPQFSIRRSLVAFETRWAPEAARIAFQPWDGRVAAGCRHYVIYEPDTSDAEHVRLILAHGEQVVPVAVPAGGHTLADLCRARRGPALTLPHSAAIRPRPGSAGSSVAGVNRPFHATRGRTKPCAIPASICSPRKASPRVIPTRWRTAFPTPSSTPS